MDVTKILVIVLVVVAVGFLVYFEMNSRRNTRKQQAVAQNQPPDSDKR